MIGSSWDAARVARWSGVSGVTVSAGSILSYPIWSFPGTRTAPIDIGRWAAAHHDRLVMTMVLNILGVTLCLVFGAAVWVYLRDRLSMRSTLPSCFVVGFTGSATLLLAGLTAFDLLLYRRRSADTSALLYDLTFGLLAMSGMPALVMLATFAVAVYTRRVLPAYAGHLALAAVAVHPLLLLAFVIPSGPLSLEGPTIMVMPVFLCAWILGTALAMPRSAE
ncbi:hypothetical protein MU0083_003878 [[Mycobacterium] kokjensenii]|uniref:DUF4386 domain-containing protein n=1 Tax=[Mycobacterium] kokjensenii TaxID=3064287 RepID=A0ABM9LX27_9MYCO|nr:hypothetical protein [Mycolicibacter sp. MU0083]CAJ1506168.1 hypothetical protein MU0083_003878 [Mycolicibacter sp. MU0083]